MEEEEKSKKWTGAVIFRLGVYISVMLVLGGILFWLCLESILAYSKWPIYTETDIVPQNEAMFPSMTFCALLSGYKEDVLKVFF